MRGRIFVLVTLLMLMGLPVLSTADDGPIPTNDIRVDEQWIDIIQSDDRSELEVVEFIFFNNTGSDIYNGSLYSWIPDNSQVISKCCGNAPDMGCRMLEGGAMLCFNVQRHNQNIVYGEPFGPYSFLSYFGQTVQLSVDGSSQNYTYSDTLLMNVTLGHSQVIGDFPTVAGEGIHITTNTEKLGAIAELDFSGGMPEKLGMIMSLNVTNLAPDDDTVELDISGLPDGWSGVFIHGGGLVRNVSVPVNESTEVILHVQAPSYKLEVQLNYFIPVEGADEPQGDFLFEKEILYKNGFVEVFVFLLEDDEVTEGENLTLLGDPQWDANVDRTRYILGRLDVVPGARMNFSVAWNDPADYSMILLGLIVIILISLVALLFLRKRRTVPEEEAVVEEVAEEPTPADLVAKKEKILLAIKRLKEDHQAGNIPDDVYDDLSAQYKSRAIEVMKEIDGVK